MACRDATIAAAALLGATCGLAGCGEHGGFAPRPDATRVLAPLGASARLVTTIPRTSSDAAVAAAITPRRVTLPHAEIGGHLGNRPDKLALEFTAKAGQVLELRLEQDHETLALDPKPSGPAAGAGLAPLVVALPAAATPGPAELRVLISDGGVAAPRYAELAAPPAGATELFLRLPADADYVVELRPPGAGLYRLALELRAPLPFPVPGYDHTAILSHFGASRESGKRRHEGVDIFVPRRTPVVAVADGQVGLHVEGRGGIAVVLSIPGISYYYAHLERTAVGDGQRVKIGDVLGYVGSTGNARGSEPHLHFGVYEFGKGAVDPLPLLEERRFAETDDAREPFATLTAALADEAPAGAETASVEAEARAGGGGGGGVGLIVEAAAGTALVAALSGGCQARFVADGYGEAGSVATMIGEWGFGAEGSGLQELSGARCR